MVCFKYKYICIQGLSAVIGIWHGCFGSKQSTAKDFLIAGGQMSVCKNF